MKLGTRRSCPDISPSVGKLWRAAIAAAVCVAVFSAPCLTAKEKKKISRTVAGAVLDQTETGIVGATVTLTDLQTGKKLAIYTKDEGHYQFSDLQPTHDYEVQASYKDTVSEVRKVSSVDTRRRIVINLKVSPPSP